MQYVDLGHIEPRGQGVHPTCHINSSIQAVTPSATASGILAGS